MCSLSQVNKCQNICTNLVGWLVHLLLDFWSVPSASEIQNGPVDLVASTSGSQAQTQDRCTLLSRGRQGKLCFINPLFLQLEVSKVSRDFFFLGTS